MSEAKSGISPRIPSELRGVIYGRDVIYELSEPSREARPQGASNHAASVTSSMRLGPRLGRRPSRLAWLRQARTSGCRVEVVACCEHARRHLWTARHLCALGAVMVRCA